MKDLSRDRKDRPCPGSEVTRQSNIPPDSQKPSGKNSNTCEQDTREETLVRLLGQSVFAIFLVVATVIFLGITVREELILFSEKIIHRVGYLGLFWGMVLSDSLPAFIPPDAFLMFSIAAELDSFWVIFSTSLGSIVGGLISYSVGRFLIPRFSLGRQIILRYEHRLVPYIRRYGFGAVVLSALTPVPFSWMAYTVGSFRMNPWMFLAGAVFRIPRMVIYYFAMLWGWLN